MTPPSSASTEIVQAFGPFRLFPSRRLLCRGDERIQIGTRSLEILTFLIERRGQVISKTELVRAIWQSAPATDATLRWHIGVLRKILGETPLTPFIINVQSRGYRFVAPVQMETGDEPSSGFDATSTGRLNTPLIQVIGRDDALKILADLIPQKRLLTITGPGGVGKTTVATAVAAMVSGTYRRRPLFVDLSPLADPDLVASTVASLLGLQARPQSPDRFVLEALHDQNMLMVFDSAENVVDGLAPIVERILASAPGVDIIVTSREPLRATGEWVYRLPPLDIPPPGVHLSAEQALLFSSVSLFVDRVRSSLDTFVLEDSDARVVSDISRWLDGIPLAIELAAAHVDFFGIRGLASRLADRFTLLTKGRRTAVARHRTLKAALDWSYEHLPLAEQRTLNALSAFKGSFSLAAASAIASGPDISGSEVMDGITELTLKSLIAADRGANAVRFRLLDTTRAYAADKLQASGEGEQVRRRHATHQLAVQEYATGSNAGTVTGESLNHARQQIDDVRAALEWAFSRFGDAVLGAKLLAASAPIWFELSLMNEFQQRAKDALRAISGRWFDRLEMELAGAMGFSLWHAEGAVAEVISAFSRAMALAEKLGDLPTQRTALWGLWFAHTSSADYRTSLAVAEAHRRIDHAPDDQEEGQIQNRMMALSLHYMGEFDRARRLAERVLANTPAIRGRDRRVGLRTDQRVAAQTLLSRSLWIQGKPDEAVALADTNIANALSIDHPASVCYALTVSTCPIAFWSGDFERATGAVEQLLDLSLRHGLQFWHSWARGFKKALALRARGGVRRPAPPQDLPADFEFSLHQLETFSTICESWFGHEILQKIDAGHGFWCAAEIQRIKGLRMLSAGQHRFDDAALLFERAIDIASRQGASAWTLRASIDLAAVRAEQGRAREGLDRLAAVCQRYPRGSMTADLVRAREFLERGHDASSGSLDGRVASA
jgi:predicted ATPase/DNA-binding winged helix-turn-helix (wHTH) protein